MLAYLIGFVLSVPLFVLLRYCFDTPSPCGEGPAFDDLPGASSRPDVILPNISPDDSYSSHAFQEKLSAVFKTYSDYDYLRREYNRLSAPVDSKDGHCVFAFLITTTFFVFASPLESRTVSGILGCVLSLVSAFASRYVYRATPLVFSYRSVKTDDLRKSYNSAAPHGPCNELDGLEFYPHLSAPFDPFVYYVLVKRIIFMESVLDSLRFRRKLLKAIEAVSVILYLFLFSPADKI